VTAPGARIAKRESGAEPVRESGAESVRESVGEPVRESGAESVQESGAELAREPVAAPWLESWLTAHVAEVVAVRRRLHAHPELSGAEYATTAFLVDRLAAAGLAPTVLPGGTGVICDVGTGPRTVALRADIDALPLTDVKPVPYRSTVDGVCHACGHDAHTAIVLGAGLALASAPALPGRIRLLFQPAEETVAGGAPAVIDAGALDGVERIFALHCDPRLDAGRLGLRVGPITAACDAVEVLLTGPGGHTARPHLTADLVYALGKVITEVPGLLSRRADPRDGVSLVWGAVEAGVAANTIPRHGGVRGTLRTLRREAWDGAEALVRDLVAEVVAPTGAAVEIRYHRGVPPVVNEATSVGILREAAVAAAGSHAVGETEQSLGGEDFAWYLDHAPGALARLGVHRPGSDDHYLDLHQPSFDIDERALAVGVRVLTLTALAALA
jgi:amidohydrolase